MEIEEIVMPDIKLEAKTEKEDLKNLILYNDDHNSFDHVIMSLIKYCSHSMLQAEQCAMIVHNNGKCAIKSGTMEKLKPIHKILGELDLTVDIE
jgi:ATP-dependent Clp protease adaptor protein ClpS